MGDLVNFNAWKKRKLAAAHQKDLEEIRELREMLSKQIEEMGEVETGPYMHSEEENSWMKRACEIMLCTLDGYSSWPIDSSDM
tara:strand:- start:5997 stop:6245 length:249 start_codon:yes stop_codon:yes gene_type:complete